MLDRLETRVRVFLAEKRFEGCNGLEVTETMRLTIAGYACLLLLGDSHGNYPQLGTIIVYPQSFIAPVREEDPFGIVTEAVEERLGESWEEGSVILAWDSMAQTLQERSSGGNIVIHEFAHQIDARRGLTHGATLLAMRHHYADWEALLTAEKERRRNAQRRARPIALDTYAYSNPEELFAVASESFIMRPIRLKSSHPELYQELQAVYSIDPANWLQSSGV